MTPQHHRALQFLSVIFGGLTIGWTETECVNAMTGLGFSWIDPPGGWFQKIAVPNDDPHEATVTCWGDTPNGPFHWKVEYRGQLREGRTITAAEAMQTAQRIAIGLKKKMADL